MPVLLDKDQAPSLTELLTQANLVGLSYRIDSQNSPDTIKIMGLGGLSNATNLEISFLSNPKLIDQVLSTKAAAVILEQSAWDKLNSNNPNWNPSFAVIICDSPYTFYAQLAQWFDQHRLNNLPNGIHETAIIHPTAQIADNVSIGPYSIIQANVKIGAGSRIGAHCVINENTSIGYDCLLHDKVTLYHEVIIGNRVILHSGCVLGADGFGFAPNPTSKSKEWIKIAQIGSVILGDDIEIGANTTIDRGAIDNTIIENGVKIDNQIMIGHNCHIGEHTAIAGCAGVAGSTKIGARCIIGGAARISGHLTVCDDTVVSGGTSITSNITTPNQYTGVFPYTDHSSWKRNAAAILHLSNIRKQIRKLTSK